MVVRGQASFLSEPSLVGRAGRMKLTLEDHYDDQRKYCYDRGDW